MSRLLASADYKALKAATRALIREAGGVESAASVTLSDAPRMSRYSNPNEALFMPIDRVADLERDTGTPLVSVQLARMAGHLLIGLPKPPVTAGRMVGAGHLGDLAKQTGDVISGLGISMADDGLVTADESRRLDLRREIHEALTCLAALDEALRQLENNDET